jgi:hypothetical protein
MYGEIDFVDCEELMLICTWASTLDSKPLPSKTVQTAIAVGKNWADRTLCRSVLRSRRKLARDVGFETLAADSYATVRPRLLPVGE